MRSKVLNLVALILTPLILQATGEELFQIDGKQVKFFRYEEMRISISKECKKLIDKKLCDNIDFLSNITLSKAGISGTGSTNPGSIICKKLLHGSVVIGRDNENNENSFCRLKDGTYIDSGTLTYYATKNEGLIKTPTRRR
ncbi:MAG: hypothetical protein ACK5Y2_08270 [Bdellovibrionales bacterium]